MYNGKGEEKNEGFAIISALDRQVIAAHNKAANWWYMLFILSMTSKWEDNGSDSHTKETSDSK